MILLQTGLVGGAIDPKYIRINGKNIPAGTVSLVEYRAEEKVSLIVDGLSLLYKVGYAQFTGDAILFTPVATYCALLELFDQLRGVYRPGTKYHKLVSTAGTNEALIKTGAAGLYQIFISNTSGNNAYLKLYDKATAPVPGTDVPFMVIDSRAVKDSIVFQPRAELRRGLAIAITKAIDDADATAVGSGDVIATLVFE